MRAFAAEMHAGNSRLWKVSWGAIERERIKLSVTGSMERRAYRPSG
jgi:hypothetical protein